MIAPTPFFMHRGCHIRIYEEIKHLQKKGHQVLLCTYNLGENLIDINAKRIPKLFRYKKIDPGPSIRKIYLDILLLINAAYWLIRFRPKVIHCHLHEGALIGILLKSLFRKKVIFDSQGSLVEELLSYDYIKRNGLIYKICLMVEKIAYRFSNKVLVSNQANYNFITEFFKRHKLDKNKIVMVSDGIDLDLIRIDDNKAEKLRGKYVPEGIKHVIIYQGTMIPLEGIGELIRATKYLKDMREDFILLLMGYPNVGYYQKIVNKYGLQKYIKLFGKIDYRQIHTYLSIGDFAITFKHSTTEGNGKLPNYGIMGLPTICYDIPANRFILDKFGFYIDVNSSDYQIAQEVNKYLDYDKELLSKIADNLKRRIRKEFSWDILVDKLIKSYR